MPFLLKPGSRSAGANVSQCAGRERELGDVLSTCRFDYKEQIVFAGGQVNLFYLDSQFLGEFLCGLAPLRSVLDRVDSLFGPVQRQNERRHVILHWFTKVFPLRCRSSASLRWLATRPKATGSVTSPPLSAIRTSDLSRASSSRSAGNIVGEREHGRWNFRIHRLRRLMAKLARTSPVAEPKCPSSGPVDGPTAHELRGKSCEPVELLA